MRALTIQQPYASLIVLPDEDDRCKRVENRTWRTSYRGPILIHAGKGKDYLKTCDWLPAESLPFGAIVGIAQLVGIVPRIHGRGTNGRMIVPDWATRRWPWLETHQHVEGPVCWILQECRALRQPIPCNGERGLWTPSRSLVETVGEQLIAMMNDQV